MGLYEQIRDIAKSKGYSVNRLEQELGFARSSINKFNKNKPSVEKLQQIADYLNVSLDFLMTGQEAQKAANSSELTARDEKDITKTLNKVMEQFENNENGPLYYDGEEIDETSRILIRNAFEYIIRETKKENKVKYNPNKNKTEK